ncbi:hypothetical protein K439DRAFT_1628826 [Ramaria rubella]|nr:hypothetical protein K439DRAFT_1628826 [Ramaria rubella]
MLPLYINPAAVDDAGEDNERKRTGLTSCPCRKAVSGSSRLPRISHRNLDIEGGLDEAIGALEPCAVNLLIGEEAGMAATMGIQDLHDPGLPQ